MLSLFTDTPYYRNVARSEERASNLPSAAPRPKPPVDAGGDRLLSPHEIAMLMVLASEPRRQQGDPADLRCLIDRGLVRLDAAPLAEARARLSDDGCQIVLRLAECDRPGRDGGTASRPHAGLPRPRRRA
ncbi:hypothetical protein [Burkholderia paludis]|uniref:hypothetical protein n=1 Tax=Burkholderia paludis TaxID=1506587 RepID=UPI000A78858E|nr:hypothetical protein [Burkholderia paludis]